MLTDEQLNNMLTKLKPILQTGVSLKRAVQFYNVEFEPDYIAYTTLMDYRKKSKKVRNKIKAWQDYPKMAARVTIGRALVHDPKLAMEYLRRTEAKEFGDKQEITQTTTHKGKVEHELDTSKLTVKQKIDLEKMLNSILPSDED